MFSFGSKLKLLGVVSKPRLKILSDSERRYASRPGDEDIKWQWSVRETPCQHCEAYTRPGWLSRVLRRRKQGEELTNRHREVTYQPRIWELEYYSYLLPKCGEKAKKTGSKKQRMFKSTGAYYSACAARDPACEGKKTVVHLKQASDDDLKPLTEKFVFESNPPFCLNQVCGKVKPPKEDKQDLENCTFKCLNDFVECKGREDDKQDKDCK